MPKSTVNVDVLVVGAGMAGFVAATAAAREKCDVMIVERGFMPGGQATAALISEMYGYTFRGERIYGGIEEELVGRLIGVGAARHVYDAGLVPFPAMRVDRLRYNPEVLKVILDWFAVNSSYKAVGGCELLHVEERGDRVRVILQGGPEKFEVLAKCVIDATGHAEVVRAAGHATVAASSPDEHEASSLLFRLSGADTKRVEDFIGRNRTSEIAVRGHKEGILPGKYLSIVPIPGTGDVAVNATRTFVDPESPIDITEGTIHARSQMVQIIPFLKENVPGLEHAGLAAVAPMIGIREARRIDGRSRITEADIVNLRRYPDEVAYGCAPMGFHETVDEEVVWKNVLGIYRIPYSAMLPRESDRILAAGKDISCDGMALTTLRCIPVVMNTGEVAGCAAALAVKEETTPGELDPQKLRAFLRGKGLILE